MSQDLGENLSKLHSDIMENRVALAGCFSQMLSNKAFRSSFSFPQQLGYYQANAAPVCAFYHCVCCIWVCALAIQSASEGSGNRASFL